MSYAQRFMQNKVPDAEGWRTVGGGGHENRAGGSMPTAPARAGATTRRWTDDNKGKSQFPSAFSKPRREEERCAPMRSQPPKQKEISLDSTEDFPTLGGKPKTTKAPVQTGWASKAASWAASDAAEAAEQRRLEAEREKEENERRRQSMGIPDLLGRILRRTEDNYRGEFQEPQYEYDDGPHSPPYDPHYEDEEYAAATAAPASNPHLDYEEEDGWTETGR